MILLIDNFDSFTYNLYQQISRLGKDVRVVRNTEISLQAIHELHPERIIIGPGPKTPADAGICVPLIQNLGTSLPILGVCLGHQCLAVAFGSRIRSAKQLMYGKTTPVTVSRSRLLEGLEGTLKVARYHSLVIDTCPPDFMTTSVDALGDIMSIEHKTLPLFGVQFHPESFLMENQGDVIIQNFLRTPSPGEN